MAEFINKIPVNVNRIEGNENVMNLEPILEGKEQVTFDEEAINSQKNCVPGPNVKFNKNALPFLAYIQKMNVPGSLGCNPNQYPKYKDGKYCCETEPSTPQEQLDYVNMLLEYSIDNVNESTFKNYYDKISYLNDVRKILLERHKNKIKDTFDNNLFRDRVTGNILYKNMDDYINRNNANSKTLAYSDLTNKTIMSGRIDNVDGMLNKDTYSNTIGNTRNKALFSTVVPKLEPKYGGKTLKKRKYTKHKSSKRCKRCKRNKPKKSKKNRK
jgi:hypothetical protein